MRLKKSLVGTAGAVDALSPAAAFGTGVTTFNFDFLGLYVLSVRDSFRDPLHNSGEAVAVGSGWAARRLFAANSTAIGKKNNAADRPSPADHRPQGVMQRVLRLAAVFNMLLRLAGFNYKAEFQVFEIAAKKRSLTLAFPKYG
jgi:hypothetical protein